MYSNQAAYEEICEKAKKYDELKEAMGKIKSEVASNAVPIQDGSEEWRSRVNDVVINIAEAIHRYTEGLI